MEGGAVLGSGIAIIPARGGSKRIPRKNLKPFLGRPILDYSIQACLGSGLFESVLVSTEDEEIAEFAQQAGASVPFRREPATSSDHATTAEVLLEVFAMLETQGHRYEWACCCYPTAPFVSPQLLQQAFERLQSAGVDGVMSVCRHSAPIWRALTVSEDGVLRMVWPEYELVRSQDLPPTVYDAGQFYVFKVEPFRQAKKLYLPSMVALELCETAVQDIDRESDWELAEMKYARLAERPEKRSPCP